MAKVYLSKKCIIEGNYWDFHPGCHGINEYGQDWNRPYSLAIAIQNKLLKQGFRTKIQIRKYKFKY